MELLIATDGSSNHIKGGSGIVFYFPNEKISCFHVLIPDKEIKTETDSGEKIIFPIYHVEKENITKAFNANIIVGNYKKPTNNRAELFAILTAFVIYKAKYSEYKKVTILSDSTYCINKIKKYQFESEKEILLQVNGELLLKIIRVINKLEIPYEMIWVRAHLSYIEMEKLKDKELLYALLNNYADKYSKYNLIE